MNNWCVTYHFDPGLPIKDQIPTYENMGLKLYYSDLKLITIEHFIDDDEASTRDEIIQKSWGELELFWQILEYRYGIPVRAKTISTQILDKKSYQTVIVSTSLGAILVKPIILPNESRLIFYDYLLPTWLKFANHARNTSDHAEAIRLYYIIIEGLKGRPRTGTHSISEIELKHTRDFVSHGESLGNPELLAFLKTSFGCDVSRYSPNHPDHIAFIRQQRENAIKIVEDELNNII